MKWLGGGLGWAAGGPVGAVLGFMFGAVIDGMTSPNVDEQKRNRPRQQTTRTDFISSLLLLSAAVMKADKKVMRSELDFVKNYLNANFAPREVQEQLLFLKTALEREFDVIPAAKQISYYMGYPDKLQLLHFMFGIAMSDGLLPKDEQNLIRQISDILGIKNADFESIRAMFIKDTNSAYKILEISKDATDEEVKKAYRRMAVKYHPDKVTHLGDEIQKAAKRKFQELQEAWVSIKKERGIA